MGGPGDADYSQPPVLWAAGAGGGNGLGFCAVVFGNAIANNSWLGFAGHEPECRRCALSDDASGALRRVVANGSFVFHAVDVGTTVARSPLAR